MISITRVNILVLLICSICLLFGWWIVKFKIEIESLGIGEIQLEREKCARVREETYLEVKCHCLLLWKDGS